MKLPALIRLANAGAVAVICIACATVALAQSKPDITAEFKVASPDALKHQLFGQIEDTLTEAASSVHNRQIGAAGAVFYWSRPQSGWEPGLCISRRVEVDLERLNDPES